MTVSLFRKKDMREEEGSSDEINVRLNSLEERTNQIKDRIQRLEKDVEMYREARQRERTALQRGG